MKEEELRKQKLKKRKKKSGEYAFRDISTGVLKKLDLTKIYEKLEKNYPTVKAEREVDNYFNVGKKINYHLIKADIQDCFEFLICILTHDKKGSDTVEIDEEEYSITSNYLDEAGEIGMEISFA